MSDQSSSNASPTGSRSPGLGTHTERWSKRVIGRLGVYISFLYAGTSVYLTVASIISVAHGMLLTGLVLAAIATLGQAVDVLFTTDAVYLPAHVRTRGPWAQRACRAINRQVHAAYGEQAIIASNAGQAASKAIGAYLLFTHSQTAWLQAVPTKLLLGYAMVYFLLNFAGGWSSSRAQLSEVRVRLHLAHLRQRGQLDAQSWQALDRETQRFQLKRSEKKEIQELLKGKQLHPRAHQHLEAILGRKEGWGRFDKLGLSVKPVSFVMSTSITICALTVHPWPVLAQLTLPLGLLVAMAALWDKVIYTLRSFHTQRRAKPTPTQPATHPPTKTGGWRRTIVRHLWCDTSLVALTVAGLGLGWRIYSHVLVMLQGSGWSHLLSQSLATTSGVVFLLGALMFSLKCYFQVRSNVFPELHTEEAMDAIAKTPMFKGSHVPPGVGLPSPLNLPNPRVTT